MNSPPSKADFAEDLSLEKSRIVKFIQTQVGAYGFQGAVVGISGGIDSAVVAALLVEALGREKVLGLLLPERDSAASTIPDSLLVCRSLGISYKKRDISPLIRKTGVYRSKPPALLFSRKIKEAYAQSQWLREQDPYLADLKNEGDTISKVNQAYYRAKHRMRLVMLYYEAEKRGYAVVGTTNKTEHIAGFYVKWGDDSSDIEPILHLYKAKVFALASVLDIPEKIIEKKPSPDLAPGITDEFAMGLSYADLDRILEKLETGMPLDAEDPFIVSKVKKITNVPSIRTLRNASLLQNP